MLFDEPTLTKITRLSLVAARLRSGVMKGDRRSTKRGTSLEFADYRIYTPGDDLRRLDWNVYARLDRPFMKLFEEEEDLAAHILVDASRSMDWGAGEHNKYRYALRLAAALGAIALAAGDVLRVAVLPANGLAGSFGPARGQSHTPRLFGFLETQAPGGRTHLDRSLRDYALSGRRPGLVFLISDLFSPGGFLGGAAELQGRGHDVVVLHLLSPEEHDPPLAGDLRLVDVETGEAQEVSLDAGLHALYRQRVQAWQEENGAACRKRGLRYLPINTAIPWDKIILQEMRSAHLVK